MRWRDRVHTTFGHLMKLMEAVEVFDPYLSFCLCITTTARWSPQEQVKRLPLGCFRTLDVCAEFAQFLIEMFVAAVDMVDTADFGDAVGFQAR